ncbi:metallophosphoesterase family protein [Chloroflexus sp.]|uniref:metallophosphoesterase family protein n=1 Tax=Chloroflexus sp. TaxID=1904827 RepID=UPI00261BCA6A|nr:exonuclease SbcCD subunit D [uncultured Chloroflexus sp.]
MIRMLHLADLHLGVENYGALDPRRGLHSRLIDYLDRLDEAITVGLDHQIDLCLIAGDIYKNRSPNPTVQREFAARIRRLREAGVVVMILTGNHDISPAQGRAHSVEIFATLALEGVIVADRLRRHRVNTRSGDVQVIAVPWVTRQMLLTRDEMVGASFTTIEYELRRRIEQFIERAVAEREPDLPTVLAFHGTVEGAQLGSERAMILGRDLSLPRSVLAQPGVDYVALGHIHRHQALAQQPPVVYPGSIERIDFGEREEPKGCVLVELAPGHARWRFVPLSARPFVSIERDLRRSSDPVGALQAAIARSDLRDAVARVEVQLTREQASLLREEQVRGWLREAGAAVIAAIVFDVERPARQRFAGVAEALREGLTPRQALELYLKSKNVPPQRIAQLLAAADELIGESES